MSPSPARTGPPWTPSTPPAWPPAAATTALPAHAPSTTSITTAPSSSTRTGTTSRPSATGRPSLSNSGRSSGRGAGRPAPGTCCALSASSLAELSWRTPPHRLLWWSCSRSFHQALLQPIRPHSTECLPNLTRPDQLDRSERKTGSYLLLTAGCRFESCQGHQKPRSVGHLVFGLVVV